MLWLTVPDATTSIPSSSWEYLAGTTTETTIKDSAGNSLDENSLVGNSLCSFIKHNGQLHRAVIAKTDSDNPTYNRAHVARLEEDGSWTLLGGDQGLRYSTTGALNRSIQAITSFDGDLYAAFEEPVSSLPRLHLARWNEGTSSWTVLTATSAGLHSTQAWTTGTPYLRTSSGEGRAAFLPLNDSLHLVFDENRSGGASGGFAQVTVGISYDGAAFSRTEEFGLNAARENWTNQNVILDNALYFFSRPSGSSGSTYVYKYDGLSISVVNLDTGGNLSLLSGDYINGHSFFAADNKLYSIWNNGLGTSSQPYSDLRIRESTDGGQTFSSSTEIELPLYFDRCEGAFIHEGVLYLLAGETPGGSSSNTLSAKYGGQPLDLKLFRRDGSSWTELGGGTVRLSSDRNAYAVDGYYPYNSLKFIDNSPYVTFFQTTHFDSGGSGAVPDGKIYLAWTAP